MSRQPQELQDDQLAFQLFAVLAGLAALVLEAERAYVNQVNGIPIAVPVAIGVAMVWRPSSVRLTLAFWSTYTCYYLLGFPNNNTNETLLFFVGAGVLAGAATCMVGQRRLRVSGGAIHQAFNPLLRICAVVLYAWTFWDKLNIDFLNPAVSCATALTGDLLRELGWRLPTETFATPAVVLTLVAEGTLALGLLFKRTQRGTALFGLAFHWLLGVAGYEGFSATMMMLLSLFLFPAAGRIFAGYDAPSGIGTMRRSTINRLGLIAYVGLTLFETLVLHRSPETRVLQVWFGLPLVVAIMWWINRAPIGESPCGHPSNAPVWWLLAHPKPLYLIALVHFLNGVSPWVGFKTEYSYAMYSNLRTEGGTTNHLFWRSPLALARYQTDLVYVLEGSDEELLAGLGGRPVPRYTLSHTLRQIVAHSQRRGIVLVIGEGTESRKIDAAERDAVLMAEPSLLEERLLKFRKIVRPQPGVCEH